MKISRLLFLFSVFFALEFQISAQSPGVYTTVDGGTNIVAASATNSYSAFAVSEHDNVGLQLTFKAMSAATSTVKVMGYKSADSTSYETTPSLNQLITLNGTTPVTTFIDVSLPNAATYKIELANTNASVIVTNVSILRRFKAPMRRER